MLRARWGAIIVLSLLLLWVRAGLADTVAIVRPVGSNSDVTETVSRLHGELISVGLQAKVIARPTARGEGQGASPAWIMALTVEGEIDAVIEIVGETSPVAVDVWIVDRSTRQLRVLRVDLESTSEHAAERLAIRAIEVLRSTLLEHDMAVRHRREDPVATPKASNRAQPERLPRPRRRETWGLDVGVAALASVDGVPPAILPIARVDWAPSSWLVAHGTLGGYGSRPTVTAAAGTARIAQQYMVVGARYRLSEEQRLRPFFGLSAGVLRTGVEGKADAPRRAHTVDYWSFLLDAGPGLELRLSGHYYLTLGAHLHLAEPYLAIHIADAVAATTGRPNLVLTLTVGTWL